MKPDLPKDFDPDAVGRLVKMIESDLQNWLAYQDLTARMQMRRYKSLRANGATKEEAALIVGQMKGIM